MENMASLCLGAFVRFCDLVDASFFGGEGHERRAVLGVLWTYSVDLDLVI